MTVNQATIEKRLAAFRQRMEEKEIDVALLWDPDNEYYLSGFQAISYSRPIIYLIYKDKTQYIIPELEKDHAAQHVIADDLFIYYETLRDQQKDTDFLQPLLRILHQLPKQTAVGIEADILPTSVYQIMNEIGLSLKDVGADLIELRSIKDAEEIHWLEQAGYLSDVALEASFKNLHVGMSELEFDSYGDQKLLKTASEQYPDLIIGYENWTCSGITRSSMPHLYSSTRKFETNDVVVHSRQVWINNYRAENERTFLIGNPTNEQKKCLELAIEAQQVAMDTVKPGVKAKDVDIASYQVFDRAGYGEYVQHRVGHGLGLTEHEEPYLRFDNELVLKEGMVYTIEPGIYIPGVGGFRHSDTVIVTKSGYRSITKYPRGLKDLMF